MLCRLVALSLLVGLSARAQDVPPTARGVMDAFTAAGALPTAAEREAAVDALWTALRAADRIPYTHADTALFLYRGTPSSVAVAGDLTGWNPSLALARAGQSTVWMRMTTLPEAARVDYKLVLGGSTWILDPANPRTQASGFGPNSELRMPAWVFPTETVYRPTVPHGQMGPAVTVQSQRYGASVTYRVWTPPGYADLAGLPVLYVTDGHEYADAALGALPIVLDNLIADGRIAPCLAVFIDPRRGGTNYRQEQYVQNPGFAAFVAEELVPAIDAAYRTAPDREARVILGTSLGGVFATYLGLQHPDAFGRLAIQSPAYWVTESPQYWTGPSLFTLVGASPPGRFTVAMTTGTIRDSEDEARRMRTLYDAGSHPTTYREVPEGHSWGNWRALYDEMLPALLPPPPVAAEPGAGETGLRLDVRPNPSRGTSEIGFELAVAGDARLACYDTLGRAVAILHDGPLGAGRHVARFAAPAAGRYTCRLTSGEAVAAAAVAVVR